MMRQFTLLALCIGLTFFAMPRLQAAVRDTPAALPAPTLMDPEVKFHRANGVWTAETYLAVPLKAKGTTRTIDKAGIKSADPRIQVMADKEVAASTGDLEIFKLTFTANDPPPAGGTHYLLMEKIGPLPYTVAKTPEPPTWTIQKLGPIAVTTGDPIPITITTGDEAISGLRIVPNTLFEKNTERPLGTIAPDGKRSLRLCTPNDDACVRCDPNNTSCFQDISIPAHGTQVLNLIGADKSGHYAGTVIITTKEGGTAKAADTVIDLTTVRERLIGLVIIALGVFVSTFGVSFLRSYQSRIEAMRQARIGIDQIHALSTNLAKTCVGLAHKVTTAKLGQLKTALELKALQANGLGKYPVSPNQTTAAGASKISSYIAGVMNEVAAVERIVRNGLDVVAADFAQTQDAKLKETFAHLDKLASSLTPSVTPEQIQAKIDDAMTKMSTRVTMSLDIMAAPRQTEVLPSRPKLDSTLAILSATGWAFVIATTILAGAYALLLSNSFGNLQDYFLCLLWGLGLPVGAQAMQMTVSSVLSSLGAAKS